MVSIATLCADYNYATRSNNEQLCSPVEYILNR